MTDARSPDAMTPEEKTMNLIEGIQQECNRVRELVKEYDAIPQGKFGAIMLRESVSQGEHAIASGDVVRMLAALKDLQGCK